MTTYSIQGVSLDQRFDRLALDFFYIHDLDFIATSLFDCKSKEYKEVLDRICKRILPRIYHQMNKLTLGQLSINRVLSTYNFPQLQSLSLVSVKLETLLPYRADHSILYHLNLDIELELYAFELILEWAKTFD
ncbi:unnamed protein product [Rotaria socialis]|uniref:Uncharacterized protein n=1 Tax=Rotaria socialis TaxID=392032 RepID=A0A821D5B3_9BILA|nr:unnamed protein product [Rotaria socialis]CAF4616292.1 unnamed protein product [Rotaria socialis]